ncbi:MAG: 4-hydroxythreonine-4-phosphate dehydrogenase PdxA, partial [Pseudomonadota bacterium]
MTKPIVISCGEPAGIGPEIAVAAWRTVKHDIPTLWLGDPAHLPAGTPVHQAADPSDIHPDKFTVLARDFAPPAVPGQPNPAHAAGVIGAIADGVSLVQDGAARALCTAPIHKAALIDGAGFVYPGHTEYLAALAGV